MDNNQLRDKFEGIFRHPPFEMSLERWTCDHHKSPWPGQYKNHETQVAWLAFIEGFAVAAKQTVGT